MSSFVATESRQTVNGITFSIFRFGPLAVIHWDGSPVEEMPADTWYNVELDIPATSYEQMQPVYFSCLNYRAYTVANLDSANGLGFYPIGGALTSDDTLAGTFAYFVK